MTHTPAPQPNAADQDLPGELLPLTRRQIVTRVVLLLALAAVSLVVLIRYRHVLDLHFLARQEAALQQYREARPLAVYGTAFLLYVAITGLSLPGSLPLTLAYGWFFGFWRALLLVSFASTTGATVAFLASRYLFRNVVQRKFGPQLTRINEAVRREGVYYLFLLRLMPFVPYILINPAMGLTPIRATTFWWVTQLGMLPATTLFIWAGSTVPTLRELAERGVSGLLDWKLFVAFVALGLFPLAVRKLVQRLRPRSA